MNLGILASHNGSNLQALIDACESNILNAKISIVISNNGQSGAAEKSLKHNIPFYHLSSVTHSNPEDLDNAILKALTDNKVNLVFLAGYMKKIGQNTLSGFHGKILNTHPALLPKFGGQGMYGINVHQAVIDAKESVSGVSIHLVDPDYDTGKIIAQTPVPVLSNDDAETLCNRVMQRERQFIVEVMNDIIIGKIVL